MSAAAADLVSVIIPCFNPKAWLLKAVASIRAQTYRCLEVILVNDGTDNMESLIYLEQARRQADVYLEQPNRGLAAARNAGIRAATGSLIVPLDADDELDREYIEHCFFALRRSPESAFVYSDCVVLGARRYRERLPDYNLYSLLDRNFLKYAALIRKEDWGSVGGYDEAMRLGYEDWEFWLRLGSAGRFGQHLPRPLFRYRRDGPSLYDIALANHEQLVQYIRERHPELFERQNRTRLKARWSPAACVIGATRLVPQSIEDVQFLPNADPGSVLEKSRAAAFLMAGPDLDRQGAELAALAVWSGQDSVRLADGSFALSRRSVTRLKHQRTSQTDSASAQGAASSGKTPTWGLLYRHLVNAELLNPQAWRRDPVGCALRLIPLRCKELSNRIARRPVFDLSFYLQFKPKSLVIQDHVVAPLVYFPEQKHQRRRVAMITPHLSSGGAEAVLMDVATALPRESFEVLLLTTHASDNRWLARWNTTAEHIYELGGTVRPERMAAAIYTLVSNWSCDAVVVQNSLFGYAALPHIKRQCPQTKILDLVHAVHSDWDLVRSTRDAAASIDIRIAVSNSVGSHLRAAGCQPDRIFVIRNGVDLERFRPLPIRTGTARKQILFASRLDPVKRPLLLVDIALQLTALRKSRDFVFVVAGDGPAAGQLRRAIRGAGLELDFNLLGHVEDVVPLFEACDVLVLPSRDEGIPLIILEAMAAGRPAVASEVGAIAEVLGGGAGIMIPCSTADAATFAAALNKLLNDPALRAEMGSAGRAKAELEFDRHRSTKAYTDLFKRIL